ncbi:MAG: invasion associated locus B family protein [Mesorhizobium sp.]
MPSLTSKAIRAVTLSAGAIGLLAAAVPTVSAQQAGAPEMPKGWFKVCGKEQDFDICNVQNQVIAQTGQMLTAIQLAEFKGKVNRRALQVSVPIGRMLPAGVTMQIDGNKPTKIEFTTCFQDRCVADAPLTDAVVASLKKGTNLTLTTYNFQNQANPIKVSLEGFTGAYDGEALNPNDMAERKNKAEEYIKANQEALNAKLKEAQDKAKSGSQ